MKNAEYFLSGSTRFSLSPLTVTAAVMTLSGLMLGLLEIRWTLQLVSMACVYLGALMATAALVIHLVRRNTAWTADGGLLLGLAALLYSGPVLPATVQDYLEYLMP